MDRLRSILCSVFLLILAASCAKKESMAPAKFDEIVSKPGDNLPLSGKLTLFPFWKDFHAEISLKYEDGRTFNETNEVIARTVEGKYIVFTMQSAFYKQPMNSIVTYDQNASAFKTHGKYGKTVTEATSVLDTGAKTYKTKSSYGDGFTESGNGSFSETEDISRTLVFQNGVLVMTRDVRSIPVK